MQLKNFKFQIIDYLLNIIPSEDPWQHISMLVTYTAHPVYGVNVKH
jgi:hypothetical protein